jgi:hypothetical protein
MYNTLRFPVFCPQIKHFLAKKCGVELVELQFDDEPKRRSLEGTLCVQRYL